MAGKSAMMAASPAAHDRYHAIDALRALAMFLGVVLHAALSFMQTPIPFTPKQDASRWMVFDFGVTFIHSFRMQLFFVVAGIFTALVLQRRALREFVAGRAKRIVLPLAGAAVFLVPLTVAPFLLAHDVPLLSRGWVRIYWSSPGQFWFLVNLVVFSAAAWALVLLRRGTGITIAPVLQRIGACATSPWALPLLVVPTALLTLPMDEWTIDAPGGWVPELATLAYYGWFFLIGVAVQMQGVVLSMGRGWKWVWPLTLAVFFPALIMLMWSKSPEGERMIREAAERGETIWFEPRVEHMLGSFVQALCSWGMIIGLFGLVGSMCSHMRAWLRWLADSSYWVYLVHLPPVYFISYWLADVNVLGMTPGPLQACVKFALVLGTALAVSLATYAALVRPTFLEAFVGGAAKRSKATPG